MDYSIEIDSTYSNIPFCHQARLRSEIPPSLRALGAAIIEAQANLVEFDLSDNAFGPDGVNACVDLLKSRAAYTLEVCPATNKFSVQKYQVEK